jgi:hypothetical protein
MRGPYLEEGDMKWVVVAFKHPNLKKSVYYNRNIKDLEALYNAVEVAASRGANLMSIRGFDE